MSDFARVARLTGLHTNYPDLATIVFRMVDNSSRCRICGCTELDCSRCVDLTGMPCSWANKARTICTNCEMG